MRYARLQAHIWSEPICEKIFTLELRDDETNPLTRLWLFTHLIGAPELFLFLLIELIK